MDGKNRERFITLESVLALTSEWGNISLLEYRPKHAYKHLSRALKLIDEQLQKLQLSLPRAFHSVDLLKKRLFKACSGIEACHLAHQKVAPTAIDVIADIKTSLSTFYSADIPTDTSPKLLLLIAYEKQHWIPPTVVVVDSRKRCNICNKIFSKPSPNIASNLSLNLCTPEKWTKRSNSTGRHSLLMPPPKLNLSRFLYYPFQRLNW